MHQVCEARRNQELVMLRILWAGKRQIKTICCEMRCDKASRKANEKELGGIPHVESADN